MKVVLDTNVFIGACIGRGASVGIVDLCLSGRLLPAMGSALFLEYEDVLSRTSIFEGAALDAGERDLLFDAFLSRCVFHTIHCRWRPNLRDEADNHIVDLAVSANASYIVTYNLRDFRRRELRFDHIVIASPDEVLQELRR